jgi:undecaprenyl-diphosphatase
MRLGKLARRLAVSAARKIGVRTRKYIAPVAPFVVTPLALGAGLSAGALVLFFNLADDIRQQDGVWRFDHDGLKLALSLRNPRRTAMMRTASALARPDLMTLIGLASLAISWRSAVHRPKGILLAVTLAGGGSIIGGIKHLFGRERPSLIEALAKEGTFSFPSGHSFISLCFYGILTSWWMRTRPDPVKRGIVLLASSNAIALIGASRVYLGVHYPSDVLAGFAAAVPWLTACLTGYAQYEKRMALLPPGPKPRGLLGPRNPSKEETNA